ncbi:uncharacterized protein LOC119728159 isoform X1 [Patiria miniata]|uniref:Uncharacterized protein n=1 Tax=Patiria miniata TaxID=46514 RepID=A0A913ZYL9_PATMI|nr:uncharacterized protein LOC119728159 isoform X1 [Patiria miniata]
METLQEYSAAAEMDCLSLPQQQTQHAQPVSGEGQGQAEFDPDRADFLEQSIPSESACSNIPLSFTNPTQEFPQTSMLQASAQQMPQTQQMPPMSNSVNREILNQRTQQLIDDINAKRKRDTTLLADFKKAMELQASSSYEGLEQAMFQMYEGNGKAIQEKLQELFATLDRISTLEMELEQFKTSLGALYSEIQGPAARPT